MTNLTYPELTSNNTQDLLGIMRFVNNAVEGSYFLAVIFIIWAIAFLGSLADNRPGHRAFLFANFISLVSAVLLSLMGLLNPLYAYFLVILLAFSLVWTRLVDAPS